MKCIDVRYQMIPKEKDEIGGDIVIFNKENNERDSRILLIFSKGTCIRKPLPDIVEGRYRLVLMAVDTGLLEDTAMELMFSGIVLCFRLLTCAETSSLSEGVL